jgi:hypothetical protein
MKPKIHYTDMPMNEYEEYDLDTFTDEQLEDYYDDYPEAKFDNDEFMAMYHDYGYPPKEDC